MIFTIFLLAALSIPNSYSTNAQCTDGNSGTLADGAACDQFASGADDDCETICRTYCQTNKAALQAKCGPALTCKTGQTLIIGEGACEAVVADGSENLDCLPACRDYCKTDTAKAEKCGPALTCLDVNEDPMGGEDACDALKGSSRENAPANPDCRAQCRSYCINDKGANAAKCIGNFPCQTSGNQPTAITGDEACTAYSGNTPNLDCAPVCRDHCLTNKTADPVKCGASLTCKTNANPAVPLADKAACDGLEGDVQGNAAANVDCTAQCRAYCKTTKVSTDLTKCATLFECKKGNADVTGDEICEQATTTVNGQTTTPGDVDCIAPCRKHCSTVKTANGTKCNAAIPCMSGGSAAVGDAICVAATTTTSPAKTGDIDCIAQCRDHCVKDTTSDATKCLAALPCMNGPANITGENACKTVNGTYDPAGVNAALDANIDCTPACRTYCYTNSTAVVLSCEAGLTCKIGTTPRTDADSCTGFKGAANDPANPDCLLPCHAFCVGDNAVKTTCEGALPCWDGDTKKAFAEAAACTKYRASTPDATCKGACEAFCGETPCTEAKKPSCGPECTAWCTEEGNTEGCDDAEDGGFSVVLSLFVLLVALL